MYSIETHSGYNPTKEYLLPLAFKDLALFHAILFSSVCLKTLSPRHKEVPRALMHLKECIHLVNKRLRSPSPMVDDSTIVVVATIALFEVRPLSPSPANELTYFQEAHWAPYELGDTHGWIETNGSIERGFENLPVKPGIV